MEIINHQKVVQKIKRMAFQIWEEHYDSGKLIIAGINNNGHRFGQLLMTALREISDVEVEYIRINLDPASPDVQNIRILPSEVPTGSRIIIADDVANTGRTLFYACQPFLPFLPSSLEAAVLVDRKHKSFPVNVDFVGLSLATTLKEHIDVYLNEDEYAVHLK